MNQTCAIPNRPIAIVFKGNTFLLQLNLKCYFLFIGTTAIAKKAVLMANNWTFMAKTTSFEFSPPLNCICICTSGYQTSGYAVV